MNQETDFLLSHVMKNYYYLLAIISFTILFTSESSAQQTCYSISDYDNKVYKFELNNGVKTDKASRTLSSLSSPEASTLNIAGDTLWILNADELHYINTGSSSLANTKISGSNISRQTLSGSIGSLKISDFDAMSVDVDGNIWAGSSDNDPCLLVVLDKSTGNVKEDFFGTNKDYLKVDNSFWSALRFDAMAFDPLTNQLYANLNGTSYNYDYLFKINTTTGELELVFQFNTINDIEGMGFDATGTLYVTTGDNASSSSLKNRLWKVDVTTGEVELVTALNGRDIETCDCVFGDPIKTVEASGYVFYDVDNDTSFNSSNDIGKSGYLLSIYKDNNGNGEYDSGDSFVDSTRTYANGFYQFRFTHGSGTEKYVIVSNTGDLPTNNSYTTNNVETVSFTDGRQTDENNNFGFVDANSNNLITGKVYADPNQNGALESYEVGVAGVTVNLYFDNNCNGSVNSGDQIIDNTTVGVDGLFAFIQNYTSTTSQQFCYIVKVDPNTFPAGASLISTNLHTASFTSGGNTDPNNNFGLWGGSVPVEWLDFNATPVNGGVELNWSTAMEENNSHFVIERTHDGAYWEVLGEVDGAGNSNQIKTYSFTDMFPYSDVNYYRIKQVDFDGKFDYSDVKMVHSIVNLNTGAIKMYPNPANNEVTVGWNKTNNTKSVYVLDLNGRVVAEYQVENKTSLSIDLLNMDSGIYFIQIVGNASIAPEKLVVKH